MKEFDTIFKSHYSEVYGFLLKMSNYNKDIAEELTSETFYQAYISIASFKGRCQLRTWLIQIAKNQFYIALRKRKFSWISLDEMIIEPVDNSIGEIVDQLYQRQLIIHARIIIDGMQPNMRDVVLYRIYSELPYSQIAILLSISESSAKVLYHRGKELLRKKLKEDYGYEI